MDAESKYPNHFSPSPLVFSEIEGVNAGSDCFDDLGRHFGTPIYEKIIVRVEIITKICRQDKLDEFYPFLMPDSRKYL
jgi:hypothetical protein